MSTPVDPRPHAGPRRRRLLVGAAALFLVVWALPLGLGTAPCVTWLEGRLSAGAGGAVHIGRLSAGWFSPVTAEDLDLRDAAGHLLVRAGRVATDRTLLGILLRGGSPGTIRVERAAAEIVYSDTGSDLERAVIRLLDVPNPGKGGEGPATSWPALEIELVDATVSLSDPQTQRSWSLPLQGNIWLFREEAVPVHARVRGVMGAGETAGSLEASLSIRAEQGQWRGGEATVKLQGLPLGAAEPLLRRWVPGARLSGPLHGQCGVTWTMAGDAVTSWVGQGDLGGSGCTLVLPGLVEPLVLDQFRAPARLRWDGRRLEVLSADVGCDLGQAHFAGTVDLAAPGWSWLDRPGHAFWVALDLPRLAEKLPRTLRIHRDLRLTAGQLKVEGKSRAVAAGTVWDGQLRVTDIAGVRGTQPISWQEPVVMLGRARQVGRGVPLIEAVECTSGFLQIDGGSTAEGFHFRADADLGQLADPLSRFIDAGPARLAGKVHADVAVRPGAADRFAADGSARISDLYLEGLLGRAVQEDRIDLRFDAAGRVLPDGAQQLDAAHLTALAGADRVTAELAAVLMDLGGPDAGLWQVKLEGDLARWQRRARVCSTGLDGWQLGGTVLARGRVRLGRGGAEVASLAISARELHAAGFGLVVREPVLELQAGLRRTGAETFVLSDVELRSASLAADAEQVTWLPRTGQASGTVVFRGELARLRSWLDGAGDVAAAPVAGEWRGRLELRGDGPDMVVRMRGAVHDLTYGDPAAPRLREPKLQVLGAARLDAHHDRLSIDAVRLDGALGTVDLHGSASQLANSCELDLAGAVKYDLQQLAPLLQPYLGDVRIEGRETRTFRVRGPLYPGGGRTLSLRGLTGDAALRWRSLTALGCEVGPADLRLCLQKGWLQWFPAEATVNGGRLRLQPNLRLEPGPAEVILVGGPVLERARVTPELCAGALSYALPAMGRVAEADGTVSVVLEGGRIPLADPSRAEIKGKMIIHAARLGPGPFTRELGGAFKLPPPTAVVRPGEVPFHLVNGRVYHRDLELVLPDVTVRTSGSVGLDGSLALVAEMPLPSRLFGAVSLSPALAKQTVRLPIGGTLEQPRLDQKALQGVVGQIARDLAGEALKHELENRLKSLLRPGGGN